MRGATALTACGPYLCLLSSGQNTGTLSVFEPDALGGPRWRGTVEIGGPAEAVSIFPYVYVTVHGRKNIKSGLRIVDLTNPDQPRIAGELEVKEAQFVAVDGPLAVVTSGDVRFQWGKVPKGGGLNIVDVSNPSRPRLVSAFNLSNIGAVALRSSLAYVGVDRNNANGTAGLRVVDVSDPKRPRMRGFIATGYYVPQSITLNGDFAYLQFQYGAVQIVNLSNPDAPALVGSRFKTYSVSALAFSEDTLYVGTNYQGLEIYNTLNPGKPARIGTPPRGETLGYMKRRVRRVLRDFAKTNPETYLTLAAATLAASHAGENAASDPARQWVLADILYGGSDRFAQGRHGRGPLKARQPARRRLRTREERSPEVWDTHLDAAAALLMTPTLPWPAHEAMYKILWANNAELPPAPVAALDAFVQSPSPLLIRFAVRALAARLASGAFVAPETTATAYVKADAKRRRAIEDAIVAPGRTTDPAWAETFARRILEMASLGLVADRLPRRLATACEMIFRRFPASASVALARTLVAALLTAGHPASTAYVLALVGRGQAYQAPAWLQTLASVPEAAREQAIQALALGMAAQAFTLSGASSLVLRGSDFEREAGWRLLSASATETDVFLSLWTSLLDSLSETPALRTAMASSAALSTLARAGLSPSDIADRLQNRPFLAGLLSPETFAALLPSVPAPVALSLIAAIGDDRWPSFRLSLTDYLRSASGLSAFWNAVPAALDADASGRLEQRLLADPEAAGSLTAVDDPSLLAWRDPAFNVALGAWVRAHEGLFPENSPLLLQAATHVLDDVRAWGLERARQLGFDLPFALRLLECGLPASVTLGQSFFAALPAGDLTERGYALALCDSPLAPVRAIGRAFVTERRPTLPRESLLQALFENSHPDMQAFVAGMLLSAPERPAGTDGFDGEVLRARQVSRRAKEQVKARQNVEGPTVDTDTLLALARSRTARDSEWAWEQLARLAQSGSEIEGVTLSGVAGG